TVKEEPQAHGRTGPRADRPSGYLAGDHKAGGSVEPRFADGPITLALAPPARRIGRSTTTQLCGCAGGCASSIRSGDARAELIHARTFGSTAGSYACPSLVAAGRG